MSIKNKDIFKFDPGSFWKEGSNYKREITFYTFENGKKKKVKSIGYYGSQFDKIIEYLDKNTEDFGNSNFFEDIDAEYKKKVAQWLQKKSNLLELVANQLVFHFLKLYEHILKTNSQETYNKAKSEQLLLNNNSDSNKKIL